MKPPWKLFLPVLIFILSGKLTAQEQNPEARSLIHLLDYIAQDYNSAIRDGKIVNESEFEEIKSFTRTAEELARTLKFEAPQDSLFFSNGIQNLSEIVLAKKEHDQVKSIASSLKKVVLQTTGLPVAPSTWPDLSKGRRLYEDSCLSCHGINGEGNGPLSRGLDPRPTNFRAPKMTASSPFQAFNTIQLGVPGTGMRAFPELSKREAWDLAFYIKSLPYEEEKDNKLAKKLILEKDLSLEDLAFLSDHDLTNRLEDKPFTVEAAIAALRNYSGDERTSSLLLAAKYVKEAEQDYVKGDKSGSRQKALAAYLEGIEPVELQLKAGFPSFAQQLEKDMGALRSAIEKEKSNAEIRAKAKTALSGIEKATSILAENKFSYWTTFFLAASVILREGLEAFLILVTILAIIRTAQAPKAAKWVHLGWLTAVLVGIFTWFLIDGFISIGGAQREIFEGLISIFAACILLYMGFWLHQKSEIGKWNTFVKHRIKHLLHGKKLFGLAAFAFIVVFREAFESVLFLSALNLEVEAENKSAIGTGVTASFVLVLFLSWILLKNTGKFPVTRLLQISSITIAILAVILVGKGVHALQETGWFSITAFPWSWRLDLIGVYPTWETIGAEAVLLVFILTLFQRDKSLHLLKKLTGW